MFGYRQLSRWRVLLEGLASAYGIAHEGKIPVSYCKYGAHAVLGSHYTALQGWLGIKSHAIRKSLFKWYEIQNLVSRA
jgi:hypothetical protein